MRIDRLLIVSVLCLSSGLGLIFGYCNGNVGANAGWPMSNCSLQICTTTNGPGALGGLALTALGALLLVIATLGAIVNQFRPTARRHSAPQSNTTVSH